MDEIENEIDADTQKWLLFANKLFHEVYAIVSTLNIPISQKGFNDPKAIAVTLLLRTLSNFRASILLARRGLIVEARTLTRCCFENLLWLGKLSDKGDDFVQEIHDDEAKSQYSRYKIIHDKGLSTDPLRATEILNSLSERGAKKKMLNPSDVAKDSPVEGGYLFYKQLSSDAAHPSLTSLARYVVKNEKMWGFNASPTQANLKESAKTVYYTCLALHGSATTLNQITNAQADEKLLEIGKEFLGLVEETKLS